MFDMVLNTPLSYLDICYFDITIQMTLEQFLAQNPSRLLSNIGKITNKSFIAWFLSSMFLTASELLGRKAFTLPHIVQAVIGRGFEKKS